MTRFVLPVATLAAVVVLVVTGHPWWAFWVFMLAPAW